MSLPDGLSPARQNPVQRIGFFVTVVLAALVLFLHFPFYGYKTDDSFFTPPSMIYVSEECTAIKSVNVMAMTAEQLSMNLECDIKWDKSRYRVVDRHFSQWESNSPIIEWFGSVVHALVSLAFALSLGGLWLWVFTKHDDG